MALTRKLLKSLGLEEAAIDTIIDAHIETTDALKKQRDDAMAEAGTTTEIAKERDQLKQQVEELQKQGGDAAKVQADFDAYKQQVETEKANAVKTAAVRKTLKESGVAREEFLDLLLGKVDLGKVEMDGEAVMDAAGLVEPLKNSYAGCFASVSEKGTREQNPLSGGGARMTKEQIEKIENKEERRAAIAANLDLYD